MLLKETEYAKKIINEIIEALIVAIGIAIQLGIAASLLGYICFNLYYLLVNFVLVPIIYIIEHN